MGGGYFVTVLLFILLQFLDPCLALPLCADSSKFFFCLPTVWFMFPVRVEVSFPVCILLYVAGGPFTPTSRLQFCSYNGTSCCNSTDDLRLQRQFQSINVSNTNCASLLRSILCAVSTYVICCLDSELFLFCLRNKIYILMELVLIWLMIGIILEGKKRAWLSKCLLSSSWHHHSIWK